MVDTRSSSRPKTRSSSRNKRDSNDSTTSDVDDADAVAVAPSAKKKRKRSTQKPAFALDSLCDDIIRLIYEMLDSSRDLYRLAFCSRYLLSCVTPEIVIRSAVFHHGHAKKIITDVMHAVKKKSVYVPSTVRLLRLVNGRRCERLEECWGYNVIGGRSGLANVSRFGGLFVCQECIKPMSSKLRRQSFAFWEDRVAFARVDYGKRGLAQPFVEAATGEMVGPICTMRRLRQIENTFWGDKQGQKDALKTVLELADKNDERASKADDLVRVFEQAEHDAVSFRKERHRLWAIKNIERNEKKMEKLRPIVAKLGELLRDAPWKHLALSCTWDPRYCRYLDFNCQIVQEILWEIICAPSKATAKIVAALADKIRSSFDALYEKDFFSYSWLSDSAHPLVAALYRYCRASVPPEKLLSKLPWRADEYFTCLIRDGNLSDALVTALDGAALKCVFALAAVAEGSDDRPLLAEHRAKFMKLARLVWQQQVGHWPRLDTLARVLEKYEAAREKYAQLEEGVCLYLAESETIQFTETADEDDEDIDHEGPAFTRMDAVHTVFSDHRCQRYLLVRDFVGLRRLHRSFYQRPWFYGFAENDED